jgi:hypothetical protein
MVFSLEQEKRLREIAREEAIAAIVAASRAQASHACAAIIDRYRVSASEVEAFLDGSSGVKI